MVGLAWSTTFGTWEPKLGGTQGREGWLKAGGLVGEGRMALWNGDKMVGEETRVIQLLVRRTYWGCDNPRLLSRAGSVHRDPLDSRLADRLEEAYRRLRAV